MKKNKWLWLVLLISLLALGPLYTQEPPKENAGPPAELISWVDLIPGVRQFSQKRPLMGVLLLGSFAAGLTATLVAHHQGYERYQTYLASDDVAEIMGLRRESEQAFRSRNLFLISTLTVFAVHVLDLTFFGKRSKIKSELTPSGLAFSLTYSF